MSHAHWQYFIAIESDLNDTGRFVELTVDNFQTYSIEFARILLSASSEIDVVAKLVCQKGDPKGTYKTIDDYRTGILSQYPKFASFEVAIPRYGLVRKPWQDWDSGRNPLWWKSYNNVKHERNKFFGDANLENALDAVAGLYCVVLAHNHDVLQMSPLPKLLSIEEGVMVAIVFN